MHLLLNPTWRCAQPFCRYCWLNTTIRQRYELMSARERPLEDWLRIVPKLHKGDMVDICGGEPFMLDWLGEFCHAIARTGAEWAITTNLKEVLNIMNFLRDPPKGGFFTASWHPDSHMAFFDFMLGLNTIKERGYPISVNIVDTVKDESLATIRMLDKYGIPVHISPYEHPPDLEAPDERGFLCKAGETHLTIGPDGTAWPCLTALRSPYWKERILGNYLDGTVDLSKKSQPCMLRCEQAGILAQKHHAGDMWGCEAKRL